MPRVTVIIPAFNSEATITETISSVQQQSFDDWEVVVSDDGSTDDTVGVVDRLADPRVRVIHGPNTGPAGARNRALEQSSGELVAFLDADDLWLPHYLSRQVGLLDGEAEGAGGPVGAVACNALIASEDGTPTGETYHQLFGRRRLDPVTLERLLRRNTVYISCLVPRDAGDAVGWFDPTLFGTEDHDLWLKILESGRRILLQDEPLAVYRRTSSSISRNTERQAMNNQRTLDRALSRGHLTRRQRRIARAELRYNRALEVLSARVFSGRRPPVAALPNLAWVAVSRPSHWRQWAAAVRSR
jgi:glycosyltransferase involved in cell wall biosynthesis